MMKQVSSAMHTHVVTSAKVTTPHIQFWIESSSVDDCCVKDGATLPLTWDSITGPSSLTNNIRVVLGMT